MKTKILVATALLAVSSITSADTLSNLLNDIPKNVSFVEQTGSCDANGEMQEVRVDNNGHPYTRTEFVADGDSCAPVIARCEKGKIALPSDCSVIYADGTKPMMYMSNEQEIGETNVINGTQTCNIQIPYQYPAVKGYTTKDVTIKATVRCIKAPTNIIQNTAKKLGITIK